MRIGNERPLDDYIQAGSDNASIRTRYRRYLPACIGFTRIKLLAEALLTARMILKIIVYIM